MKIANEIRILSAVVDDPDWYINIIERTEIDVLIGLGIVNTLGESDGEKVYLYILSHIDWGIRHNVVGDKPEEHDYESLGKEFFNTIAHEFRHVLQEEIPMLPKSHPEVYKKDGVFNNEKYAEDEGEKDAFDYANKMMRFAERHYPRLFKVLGRYVMFCWYITMHHRECLIDFNTED